MNNLTREKVSYYMSAMVMYNLFYIIAVLSGIKSFAVFDENGVINDSTIYAYASISLALVFFVWGLVYTIVLIKYDFTPFEAEEGIRLNFESKENITANEFFSKFALLALTGLTIGNFTLYWGIIIYLLFLFSIGTIYIRLDLLYLNPLLIMIGYNVYRCKCKDKENLYYFITNNKEFDSILEVRITFTRKRIIRLSKGKQL